MCNVHATAFDNQSTAGIKKKKCFVEKHTSTDKSFLKVIYSFMLYFLKQTKKIAYSGEENHFDAI